MTGSAILRVTGKATTAASNTTITGIAVEITGETQAGIMTTASH